MAVMQSPAKANQQVVSRSRVSPEQKKQIEWLQTRMRKVKNQMDFVEIISNFLPSGMMDGKADQLDKEMKVLNQQYTSVLTVKSPFNVQL